MNTAALQVFDESGRLKLDSNRLVLRLLKAVKVPVRWLSWNDDKPSYFDITVEGRNPLVFFSEAHPSPICREWCLRGTKVEGTGVIRKWTFTVGCLPYSSIFTPPLITDEAYRVYIFDTYPQSQSNFGLETYDENGFLTFSSHTPPMKVQAVVNLPEYIESDNWNCVIARRLPGSGMNPFKSAVCSNVYREGFYGSETHYYYVDTANEYICLYNQEDWNGIYDTTFEGFGMHFAPNGVEIGAPSWGGTLGGWCWSFNTPLVMAVDIDKLPFPFG